MAPGNGGVLLAGAQGVEHVLLLSVPALSKGASEPSPPCTTVLTPHRLAEPNLQGQEHGIKPAKRCDELLKCEEPGSLSL